jgi:Na+-translocating ferredoxin:NAD+ oxidoreductase RnfC subunit
MIMVYKHLTDIESHIPAKIGEYPVVKVRGGYPATPSFYQLRKFGKGRKLFLGVGAAIQLHRALKQNMVQHTTFITVAGNCVSHPVNMEVSLGMTVSEVLERIGLTDKPTDIVCGGPMRGFAVINPEHTLIMATTRAVLAIRQGSRVGNACVGCGRCEQVCPSGLNPAYINRFMERGYTAQLRRFDAHLCVGCGTCAYICPSRLDLVRTMGKAKAFALRRYQPGTDEGDEAHAG